METIFDHNISPEEWKAIGGLDKELYLSIVDEDSANADLAALFWYRKKKREAKKYLNKISDESYRLQLWFTLNKQPERCLFSKKIIVRD